MDFLYPTSDSVPICSISCFFFCFISRALWAFPITFFSIHSHCFCSRCVRSCRLQSYQRRCIFGPRLTVYSAAFSTCTLRSGADAVAECPAAGIVLASNHAPSQFRQVHLAGKLNCALWWNLWCCWPQIFCEMTSWARIRWDGQVDLFWVFRKLASSLHNMLFTNHEES